MYINDHTHKYAMASSDVNPKEACTDWYLFSRHYYHGHCDCQGCGYQRIDQATRHLLVLHVEFY
jgi:hypothetical protein